MSKHKWIDRYCEIVKKTPEYKKDLFGDMEESLKDWEKKKIKNAIKDDFERYCKDKVVTLLRYLFYNRGISDFSTPYSLHLFKPRGTMFADRRIDIGDYVVTDTLVEKTFSEKRNYEKDDRIKYIEAKYALFENINSLFESDKNYVPNDILKYYKGYFFVKADNVPDMYEAYSEVREAYIRFMYLGYYIAYYENYEDRYSANKPIAIFNARNSRAEQSLFLSLILKYDELSPEELDKLNRDHWEIIDIKWRNMLYLKLRAVLFSKKWYQCQVYQKMLAQKLFHPARYRFEALQSIIDSCKGCEAESKKEIIKEFKKLTEDKQQKIFTAIECRDYSDLNEEEKKWCDTVNDLDDYAEKILTNQESEIEADSEEIRKEREMRLSKKMEYEKLLRELKITSPEKLQSANYPPWIKVNSFEEDELEEAIRNCQQDDLINLSKFLRNFSFPIAKQMIKNEKEREISETKFEHSIAKKIKKLHKK